MSKLDEHVVNYTRFLHPKTNENAWLGDMLAESGNGNARCLTVVGTD